MKNLSTWLLVMFMLMFWAFRVMVALSAQLKWDFAFTPINLEVEIVLLFVVLACVVLVIKRKVAGGLMYLLAYGLYFGVYICESASKVIGATEKISIDVYSSLFISILAMTLAIAVLFDLLVDKNRQANPKDSKTDFFYKNEKFDRQMDERSDRNNYRTM